tara:strand:- start:1949 stop:2818 length:870 start_codon:yes stop_codon:yes gene_type:complete
MAIVPTPPAQPVNPTQPLSQTAWATSGIPASGVTGSGVYCSAMHIQEQLLDYKYKRVPIGTLNWNTSDVSLTGVNIGGVVDRTVLIIEVLARTSAYVVSGECWSTSSFSQSQRFAMNTVSAIDGISYGVVGAGKMGPGGHIFNEASGTYYRRQPYDAATMHWLTTWSEDHGICYNFAMLNVSGQAVCSQVDSYPNLTPMSWWGTDNFFSLALQLGKDITTLCGAAITQFDLELGMKPGAYSSATQDTTQDIQQVTDRIGAMARDGELVTFNNNSTTATHYNPGLHYWGP